MLASTVAMITWQWIVKDLLHPRKHVSSLSYLHYRKSWLHVAVAVEEEMGEAEKENI